MINIGDFLVVKDELQPADVIHVIAGPDYRAEHAIKLYKQGYAKYIFFTGGWCVYHKVHHAEHGKELALRQGVPVQAIITNDDKIISTYEEAGKLKDWMSQSAEDIDSVIVVSDPFHMRRARWTYRLLMGDKVQIQMSPVPFDAVPFQSRWWADAESRKYVRDEYIKFAYYWLRYKIKWAPIQSWLIALDQE